MNEFDPKNLWEVHVIVWGRVQGVGFRVAARHYALQLDLKGYVGNLGDGNVEIVAQGYREKLEEFISLIKEHFGPGYIARMDIKYRQFTNDYQSFQII